MRRPEPTRALVVDDERLARLELRRLLADHSDCMVVGEAASCEDAALEIARLRPDLLLLDVQMPDGTGFDLLHRLELMPAVIFTTAYDSFALEAFEVDALDYLLKPVEAPRLAEALGRLRRGRGQGPPAAVLEEGLLGPTDRVLLRDGDRCRLVAVSEILLLESDGGGTRVSLRRRASASRKTATLTAPRSLAAIEARLDPALFVRANRRQVINTRWIREVDDVADGPLTARLDDGSLIQLSRRRAREFRRRMEL